MTKKKKLKFKRSTKLSLYETAVQFVRDIKCLGYCLDDARALEVNSDFKLLTFLIPDYLIT